MRRLLCIFAALVITLMSGNSLNAQSKTKREPQKMGTMIRQKDSTGHTGRMLDRRLFIPKGAKGAGIQFSYFSIGETDSEVMMLIQDLNAHGSYFSAAPFIMYCLADNKAVGIKLKYSNAETGISNVDLSLLSDDLSLNLSDISGMHTGFSAEFFYRSYLSLDSHGRFGLFNDIALQYSSAKTGFSYNGEDMDAHTINNKIKLAVRPGLEVFVMNNVSTHFSLGIGGISYTNTQYVKGGITTGTKNVSRARFMPDVTDISMGMTIHF